MGSEGDGAVCEPDAGVVEFVESLGLSQVDVCEQGGSIVKEREDESRGELNAKGAV